MCLDIIIKKSTTEIIKANVPMMAAYTDILLYLRFILLLGVTPSKQGVGLFVTIFLRQKGFSLQSLTQIQIIMPYIEALFLLMKSINSAIDEPTLFHNCQNDKTFHFLEERFLLYIW